MAPRQPGSYVLILRLARPVPVEVGRLGRFTFAPGWYGYAGSALGPGGLAARVQRHLRAQKAQHWHIDYLRAHATPTAVWYTIGQQRRECRWADVLSELPGAWIPAPRFGASDCHCPTHLVGYPTRPRFSVFSHHLSAQVVKETFDA